MQPLRFDPEAHAYYLGAEQIPGVTAVLQQVTDYRFVPDEVLDRKKAIGSALHACIELDHIGELDESTIDPAVAGYFDAWRKFTWDQRAFVLAAAESPMCSRLYRYGTTPDIWGSMHPDGGSAVPFVLELKSTATIMPAVALQTAAQLQAIAETVTGDAGTRARWLREGRRFALQLKPTGTYSLREFRDPADWPTFAALLAVYRWKRAHNITI